jgi:hypothetical protein
MGVQGVETDSVARANDVSDPKVLRPFEERWHKEQELPQDKLYESGDTNT